MLTVIDGWWGSGKSVLRGLLDGHPQVFVSPIQDSVPGAFTRDRSLGQWIGEKDTEALRSMLAGRSEYYRIERFARRGSFHSDTSKSQRNYSDFKFDFYHFDQLLFDRLTRLDRWTPEGVSEQLYETMQEVWCDYPVKGAAVKLHVTMDNNHPTTADSLMSDFTSAKLLYVKRSPAGILATRAGRKPIAGDYRSQSWEVLTIDGLIEAGEVERIVSVNQRVAELQKLHPDRIKIIDFEDIVLRTSAVMPGIADFLGIDWCDDLLKFTYAGNEVVSSNGETYIGKINDQPEDLLTSDQMRDVEFFAQSPNLLRILGSRRRCFLSRASQEFKMGVRKIGSKLLH